jgi:hypothetical protein
LTVPTSKGQKSQNSSAQFIVNQLKLAASRINFVTANKKIKMFPKNNKIDIDNDPNDDICALAPH